MTVVKRCWVGGKRVEIRLQGLLIPVALVPDRIADLPSHTSRMSDAALGPDS
jgi:hypothetical protein